MSNDNHCRTVSVSRLADMLDVPAPTIRGWLSRGVLPSVKICGRRLVRLADVERLLSSVDTDKAGRGEAHG